ncbi:AraC family transcriptional regulator [Paenibacillus sp. PK3_47]|uniref:helix-turn-helix domain-containing protein n=1 Tax=Paenibacillus sp. PK3_47 TaxID=2072642 RepID=UPI00201D3488|nr:helix-turn-helix domain-containing protein [Paenibacillus sp. PK3_47]UQZ36911.1 AraC family transcriptional regulator [Paenibacillus sp. PK3_47]
MAENPNYSAIQAADTQYTHPAGILVSDYYSEPYGYTCYRPEGTKDWLIMYTLSGKGSIYNGNGEYLACTERMLTIVSPGTPQDYFMEVGYTWEKLWAHFLPRLNWMDWLPSSNTQGPVFQLKIEDDNTSLAIESAFRRVLSYRLYRDVLLRDELTLNALEEIILLVASQNLRKKELDPRISEVLDMLAENYMEEHAVEDLAAKVCLSPSRLSHLFKQQVGDSIIETLIKYRLNQAEKLIKYTVRPITEIALAVGFNTPDYFTKKFTGYFGSNPSNYRKQQRDRVN